MMTLALESQQLGQWCRTIRLVEDYGTISLDQEY